MSAIRKEPCTACPYRQDCPSGLWEAHEYDKLLPYDEPTHAQPLSTFQCHATPDHYCHGWAVVHSSRGHDHELLALRFAGNPEIPEAHVPLFASGQEAADWGKADIDDPGDEAMDAAERLGRKYPRLRSG